MRLFGASIKLAVGTAPLGGDAALGAGRAVTRTVSGAVFSVATARAVVTVPDGRPAAPPQLRVISFSRLSRRRRSELIS
jgi:hypothetical protein